MKNELRHILEGVGYSSLEAVGEAYKDNGATVWGVQKAHSRMRRGNNLIPEKKRKSYIAPVVEEPKGIIIGGVKYKNDADACRKRHVKYPTFRKRLSYGWDKEEALGLKSRKRGKQYSINGEDLTAKEISEKYDRNVATVADLLKRGATPEQAAGLTPIQRGELISQVEYQQKHGKKRKGKIKVPENKSTKEQIGKRMFFRNKEYPSLVALAESYGKDSELVRSRLSKGWTVAQALDLEPRYTFNKVVYKDKTYPSKKSVALAFGLALSSVYRLPKNKSLEEGIDELLNKKSPKGKKNEAYYRNHPEEGNATGYIYLCRYNHPKIKPAIGKVFYKVGITKDIEKRKRLLKYTNSTWYQEDTMLNASIVEAQIKGSFQDKLTRKFTARDLDGKGEIFEVTTEEARKIKIFIALDLEVQKNPDSFRQMIRKFKSRSH
jgi:hypothetical protein